MKTNVPQISLQSSSNFTKVNYCIPSQVWLCNDKPRKTTFASHSQPLGAMPLGSGPSSQNTCYSQQTEVISCWQIGCIQKMSWEQAQWLELCSLPCLGVSVTVFGFTAQDPAGIHHLFICSFVPSHLSLLLLCLLLLLDSPHELHSLVFWLHRKFSSALVKVNASFLALSPTPSHRPTLLC